MINLFELKNKTKKDISESKPSIVTATLLFLILCLVLSFLMARVLMAGSGISQSTIEKYYEYYSSGDYENAMALTDAVKFAPGALAICLAIGIVSKILEGGYMIFAMNTVRKSDQTSFWNLLDGFGIAVRYVIIKIIKGVVTYFGTIAFVFPGLLFHYTYRQTERVLIDNPGWNIFRCMKESRLMMKGRRWELFTIDVRLLHWHVLSVLGDAFYVFAFVNVFLKPLITCLNVNYYEMTKTVPETVEV